jgi:acyl dehydratase
VNFDALQVGRVIHSEEFRVNTTRLAQFAAAINDTDARHREGSLAPPVFAAVPPMQATIETLHKVTTAFALHGEHDFWFHAPIRPGLRLYSSARLVGVHSTAAGASIVIKTDSRTDDGQVLNEQYFTALVAGETVDSDAGERAPEHRVPESVTARPALATLTFPIEPDQTRRYADAARDYSDYTMDAEAARAKGFEAPLVHGMLTLAIASRAVVAQACGGDSTRLSRLACRFSGPVYLTPDQALTVQVWALDQHDGRASHAFAARDSGGRLVLKHGVAEVAA